MGSKKILVIFGATGDLIKTKILPALFEINKKDKTFSHVIAYGRRELNNQSYYEFIQNNVYKYNNEFLKKLSYIKGELDEETGYNQIKEFILHQCRNVKKCTINFYIPLSPKYYEIVLANIQKKFADLNFRIALEKPLGGSLKHAHELIEFINNFDLENKTYLVDHYLGKPSVLNLLNLPKNEGECLRDISHLRKLEIDFLEAKDVSHRGEFYDHVGALRDVGQNHLLAILASFLVDHNLEESGSIRRMNILRELHYKKDSIKSGQYEGFKDELGVTKNSQTETYFEFELACDNNPGLEITLRAGKALASSWVGIKAEYTDKMKVEIGIEPDTSFRLEGEINHEIQENKKCWENLKKISWPTSGIHAYEVILKDFLSNDWQSSLGALEVRETWRITEEIMKDMKNSKLHIYEKGSPVERIIND